MINDKPEKIDKAVGKPCKFGCGIQIFWKGFDKTIKYDTGWREIKYPDVVHTFQRCFDLQKENGTQNINPNRESD